MNASYTLALPPFHSQTRLPAPQNLHGWITAPTQHPRVGGRYWFSFFLHRGKHGKCITKGSTLASLEGMMPDGMLL